MNRLLIAALMLAFPLSAQAAELPTYTLSIKEHKFSPETVKVPAGKRLKLVIRNEDATPEEFESHDLKREKVVQGHAEISVNIGPLKPGEYKYFGEFHPATAHGSVIAE